jgi:hypothetical protein
MAFTAEGFDSDACKPGGLREKNFVETWNLRNLRIVLKTEGQHENPLTDVQSQDLPDTY